MEKNYDKLTMKFSPCKVPDPCRDYSGYNPCEFSDEITEKDLAILKKEEQAKLDREKEAAAKAELEAQKQKQKQLQLKEAEKSSENKEQSGGTQQREAGTLQKEAVHEKRCHRSKNRPCKKLEPQNPFFKNRLSFSSDLPPPPPIPPPQFFPLVSDSDSKPKICPKRKKKCDGRTRTMGEKTSATKSQMEENNYDKNDDYYKNDNYKNEDEYSKNDECRCSYENECLEGKEFDFSNTLKKIKRQYKKPVRPPCRKKESEVSISLQPRQIPAVQRDLPSTCPKDIPEVERQILMANEQDYEINYFKKKCRKNL